MQRSWFSPVVPLDTGRLCSAGSGRQPVTRLLRSYSALRLPRLLRPRLRSSLAFGLPAAGAFSVAGPLRSGHFRARARGLTEVLGVGSPAPRNRRVSRWRNEGLPGAWVVLFVRAAAMYPAGAPHSRPSRVRRRSLPGRGTLGRRFAVFSWLAHCGPLARVPTHRRRRYRRRRKARYRPGRLSRGRAGFAPAGRLLRIS